MKIVVQSKDARGSVTGLKYTEEKRGINLRKNFWKKAPQEDQSSLQFDQSTPAVGFQDAINIGQFTLQPKYFVIRADSEHVRRWDIAIFFALIFTAIVTPYEVALLEASLDPLFFINRVIDLMFVCDMIMNFFLTYYEEGQFSGRWITDRAKIRRRYLRSWFIIDLFSIIPFDVLSVVKQNQSISKLKIVRIVRLLRLLKMVRILKASKIFKRWEDRISISFSVQSLIKFAVLMVCMGHWLACLWAIAGRFHSHEETSWEIVYCNKINDVAEGDDAVCSSFMLYTAALYFSIYTITSIGYGDITPTNELEAWICIFIMLIGSAAWAYVIGNASGIVATMDQDSIMHHQTMDNLNQFVKEKHLPADLCKQLRSYFNFSRGLMKTRKQRELINDMSPALRRLVAARNLRWVQKVPWCRTGLTYEFVIDMVQQMTGATFIAQEHLPHTDAFVVIQRGVASRKGRILLKGGFWGADCLLTSSVLRDKSHVIAMSLVEILQIGRDDLFDVMSQYPKDFRLIRKRALYMALQKALLLLYSFKKNNYTHCKAMESGVNFMKFRINPDEAADLEELVFRLNPKIFREITGREYPMRGEDKKDPLQNDASFLGKGNELLPGQEIVDRVARLNDRIGMFSSHIHKLDSKLQSVAALLQSGEPLLGQQGIGKRVAKTNSSIR